jgi:hypothetical protein
VSKWIEVACPKDSKSVDGVLWDYRANHSTNVWHVFLDGQTVSAVLTPQTNLATKEVPKFSPEAEKFKAGINSAVKSVVFPDQMKLATP